MNKIDLTKLVAPLVWVKSQYYKQECATPYVVQCVYDRTGKSCWAMGMHGKTISDHDTLELAKAAAQSDHAAHARAMCAPGMQEGV